MKFYGLMLVVLLGTRITFSQDWTGAVDSDWNNPANWSDAPQTGDNITISTSNYTGAMAHPVISAISSFSPAEVAMDGGAILTVNAGMTTTDRVEIIGAGTKIVVNSGILTISGGAGNARFIFSEGAQFEMNGGQLIVGQRLLFELGASGVLNAGIIDIAETFALIDGDATASSTFIQNAGQLITEEFGFENEAGEFYPKYLLNGGTLQINGAMLMEGVSPGSGRGTLLATAGICRIYGTIGAIPASTMNYTLQFEGTNVLEFFGTSIDQLPGDSIIIQNGAEANFGNTLTWQNDGVVTGKNAELNLHGNVSLNGNGTYQFPNVFLALTKSLNHLTASPLLVNGDFRMYGVYNQLQHSLEFNGDVEQEFLSAVPLALNHIVLNNSGEGVRFDHNLYIDQSISWINGILKSDSTQVVLAANAVSLTPSENSYAVCTVVKQGNQAFAFPVGSENGNYRPVEISAPISSATVITVTYQPEAYPTLVPVEVPLQSVSTLEYWDVQQTGSMDAVNVSVSWNDASQSGLVDCSSITLANWENGQWNFVPSITTGLCSGTGSGSLASTVPVNLSPLTIGFTEAVYQQQVELCFGDSLIVGTSSYDSTGVYIDSLTDINGNDSLVVTALTVFPQINVIVTDYTVALGTNEPDANYQWLDCNDNYAEIPGATEHVFTPVANGSYAVRIEKNGCVDTSACYVIDELSLPETQSGYVIYPNPVNGIGEFTVKAPEAIERVIVVDALGQPVAEHNFFEEQVLVTLSVGQLPDGIYIVRVKTKHSPEQLTKLVISNHW